MKADLGMRSAYAVAQSNWLVLIVAVVTAAAARLYVYANERDHRGEP
jgi:hypothetical protein